MSQTISEVQAFDGMSFKLVQVPEGFQAEIIFGIGSMKNTLGPYKTKAKATKALRDCLLFNPPGIGTLSFLTSNSSAKRTKIEVCQRLRVLAAQFAAKGTSK